MHQLKPLEDSILARFQYLLEEFEPDNVPSELAIGFVEYCSGCIAMFKTLHPEVPFMELRPFFRMQADPRPLRSTNEAAIWVQELARMLERELLQKRKRGAGDA